MNSFYAILVGIVVLAAVIGGIFYFRAKTPTASQNSTVAADTRALKTYYDPRYGVAFNFRDSYTVQDHDSTSGVKHHTIIVGDKAALANPPKDSEGPPVMTIDIYDNPTKASTEKWIKNNDFSNYKLSQNSALSTTTVAGIPAYAYPWDGLYTSLSIVFPDNGKMYMMSVNYNSPSDQIYKDFAEVVASMQFDQ
jgi:hypothetical protein